MRRTPELRTIEYANVHEEQRRSFDVLLRDVLQDRQRDHKGPERHERVSVQPPDLARLAPEERERAESNIRLLWLLKGHRGRMIRNVSARGQSAESAHLRALLEWTERTIASGMASVEPLVAPVPSGWWAKAATPEDLYERLTLIERSGTNEESAAEAWLVGSLARITGSAEAQPKWTDLVKPMFDARDLKPRLKRVLDEVGFIPRGLTMRQTFRALPGTQVVAAIDALRELEDSQLRPVARYERARLTNALIARGRASDLRSGKTRPATLDTNGVRIDVGGFHAHVPYGLLEEDALAALERDHWTPGEPAVTEMRLRAAEENMDGEMIERTRDEQLARFLTSVGFKEPGALAACVTRVTDSPDALAKTVLELGLTVPDRLIQSLASAGPEGRYALLRFAEGIGAALSEERLTRRAHLFLSYDLMSEQDESYRARARVLHQPGYYNALKIVRGWVGDPVSQQPERHFLALHGRYQQTGGQEPHAFLAAVLNGRVTRVLFDEQKHLHEEHRAVLKSLPSFDREQYDTLEDVFRTFDYFSNIVNSLRKEAVAPPKSWPKRFHDLSQTALHFVLSNVTACLPDADARYREATAANASRESVQAMLEVLDDARQRYAEFLYRHVGSPDDLEQEFMPEVEKRDLAFGQPFLEYAKATCAKDGYDENLSQDAQPIRVVQLRYKADDPTRAIPYHIEEACLEALRLNRNRPLVNIVGGARFAGGGSLSDAEHPLNRMATSVLRVSHDVRANVGVPGTQSGIGVAFGLANVHYRNEFGHLPRAEQAHLFAISPGGNTAFPGNEWTDQATQNERFAVTPVDSIITPFESDWGAEGLARLTTPYRDHIAYMEALYDRVSRDQKRVTVAGNGGLYSVMEINESLPRGFNLLLIRDSGRFAEAAAAAITMKVDASNPSPESAAAIIAAVQSQGEPGATEEFLRKDFGADPANPTESQQAFRIAFFQFLRLAKQFPERIAVTTQQNLETDLRAMLA